MPPAAGLGVEDGDGMAFLGQVPGGGESGRSGADDGGALARRRQLLRVLPPQAGVVVVGHALQAADRQRVVELAAQAGRFAHGIAGAAEDAGEGQLLAHDGDGFAVLAFGGELDVARHVDAGRAGGMAGHLAAFAQRRIERAVGERAGRADGDAGAAELAAGFDQRRRDGADVGARALRRLDGLQFQAADAADVVADGDAAPAVDAQVVVAVEQRLVLDHRQAERLVDRRVVADADEVGDLAQFAVGELLAAAGFRRVAVGTLRAVAAVALGTGQADMRMIGEDLGQRRLPCDADERRLGAHRQAFRHFELAGVADLAGRAARFPPRTDCSRRPRRAGRPAAGPGWVHRCGT